MQVGLVRDDIAALADSAILLLGGLLFVFSLVLIYILIVLKPLHAEVGKGHRVGLIVLLFFLLCGGMVYVAPTLPRDQFLSLAIMALTAGAAIAAIFYFGWVRPLIFFLFFLLCGGTVFVAHTFARDLFLLSAIAALTAGAAIATIFYFGWVRPLVRVDDNRIPFTMMVVGAMGVVTILALLVIWLIRDRIKFDTTETLGSAAILQVAGLVFSAVAIVFTYLMRTEQANRTANQQIYQTLELQSVQLFRFEADHPDLVEKLWFGPVPRKLMTQDDMKLSPREEADLYVLRQYVCQMLNLFEMAYRFRIRGIMEAEVFGSWVIWMWELCESEVFCAFWKHEDGLPSNYVRGFSDAMTIGVELRVKQPPISEDARKREFFEQLAKNLGCPEIKEWLD